MNAHHFPFINNFKRAGRALTAAVAIAASGALLAPVAQAGVVFNPASITDHGTYITDTVNHRDWYKFDNVVNTVGWSVDAWLAAYGANGWAIASLAQVQGLQSQFGWAGDTFSVSYNANYALTEAMAEYLGHTIEYTTGGTEPIHGHVIEAMTSDGGSVFNDVTNVWDAYRQVTTSQFFSMDLEDNSLFMYGDYVNGEYRFQREQDTDESTGIWLSRASADEGPGGVECTRLTPCPSTDVPEPAPLALTLLGLVVLLTLRRTRYATLMMK